MNFSISADSARLCDKSLSALEGVSVCVAMERLSHIGNPSGAEVGATAWLMFRPERAGAARFNPRDAGDVFRKE